MKNTPRQEQHSNGDSRERGSMLTKLVSSMKLETATMAGTLSYLVVFVLLVILYIANANYHIKTLRSIKDTQNDLKEIQAEYVSLKADLANKTKASEMAKSLKRKGIKELRTPPYRIEEKE